MEGDSDSSKSRNRTYCCVFGCVNSNSANPDLSFFSVPTDQERRSQWLAPIGRLDLMDASCSYRVCEEHFQHGDVLAKATRKILKKTALPSRHLPRDSEPAEDQQTVKEDVVNIKQEIEDSFSEHEDDIMEKLENKKRGIQPHVSHVPTKKSKVDTPTPQNALTVTIERVNDNSQALFPVDFMKKVLNTQNEIATILKSQVLLQDPDTELMKFLRLMGVKLQRLSSFKRKKVQKALLDLIDNAQ